MKELDKPALVAQEERSEVATELLQHLPSNWSSCTPKKTATSGSRQIQNRKRKRAEKKKDDTTADAAPKANKSRGGAVHKSTLDETTDAPDDRTADATHQIATTCTLPERDTPEHSKLVRDFHTLRKPVVLRNETIVCTNRDIAYESVSEKIHDIYAAVIEAPQSGTRHSTHPKDCIELESIVANVPFLETMQLMFSLDDANTNNRYKVPIITKDYEEMYMRESFLVDDIDCIMGSNCECMFIDAQMPFVGTRFWSEQFVSGIDTDMNISNKMCVLCCRKNTQQLFYDLIFSGVRFNGFIQLYGNICSTPNEYAKEAVLICPPNGPVACMPYPVVAHQRNRYTVVVKNGVKYMKQHNVFYEDFHKPSSFT
jgi:hypothetical protein